MLAKAVGQADLMVADTPLSRASIAPTGDVGLAIDFRYPPNPVGAELARESGGSNCIDGG
ncbi:hypothetical protein C9I50_20810 [Pseudomonas prosekii]|nr:hypothetical protein C9I50_20810 [Pseudomonas prosekii]